MKTILFIVVFSVLCSSLGFAQKKSKIKFNSLKGSVQISPEKARNQHIIDCINNTVNVFALRNNLEVKTENKIYDKIFSYSVNQSVKNIVTFFDFFSLTTHYNYKLSNCDIIDSLDITGKKWVNINISGTIYQEKLSQNTQPFAVNKIKDTYDRNSYMTFDFVSYKKGHLYIFLINDDDRNLLLYSDHVDKNQKIEFPVENLWGIDNTTILQIQDSVQFKDLLFVFTTHKRPYKQRDYTLGSIYGFLSDFKDDEMSLYNHPVKIIKTAPSILEVTQNELKAAYILNDSLISNAKAISDTAIVTLQQLYNKLKDAESRMDAFSNLLKNIVQNELTALSGDDQLLIDIDDQLYNDLINNFKIDILNNEILIPFPKSDFINLMEAFVELYDIDKYCFYNKIRDEDNFEIWKLTFRHTQNNAAETDMISRMFEKYTEQIYKLSLIEIK